MRMTFSTFVTPTRDSDTWTAGADACTSGNRETGVRSIDSGGYRADSTRRDDRPRDGSQMRTPAAVVTRPAKRNTVWRSEDSRSNGSSAEMASRGITTSYQRSAALAAV